MTTRQQGSSETDAERNLFGFRPSNYYSVPALPTKYGLSGYPRKSPSERDTDFNLFGFRPECHPKYRLSGYPQKISSGDGRSYVSSICGLTVKVDNSVSFTVPWSLMKTSNIVGHRLPVRSENGATYRCILWTPALNYIVYGTNFVFENTIPNREVFPKNLVYFLYV